MALSCPNKSLKAWKDLVKSVGEPYAYLLWNEYDGNVPIRFYEEIKDRSDKSSSKKRPYKYEDTLDQQDEYSYEDMTGKPSLLERPDKSSKQKEEDLNNKLRGLMSELGVSVEVIENLKNDLGMDADGIADIINKIIFINKNTGAKSLPEEVGHFIIELLGKSPLVERMLSLVAKNDYYKSVLGDKLDLYTEHYKGDVVMLIKEAAGQILGNAIRNEFNNEALNLPEQQLFLLNKIWNYIKSLFSKVNKNQWIIDINQIYGNTAREFLSKSLEGLDISNLDKNIKLPALSEVRINRLKEVVDKARRVAANRHYLYERKDMKSSSAKEKKFLEKSKIDFDNKRYINIAVNAIKHTNEMYARVSSRLDEIKSSATKIDSTNMREVAKVLREMKNFNKSYMPILEELQVELRSILREEPDNESVKEALKIASDLQELGRELDQTFREMAIPAFAEFIRPFIGNGPLKDLEGALKYAEEDITFMQRWLDSMAEAGDPILQLIDVSVKDAKLAAMQDAYDLQKDLVQRAIDLEKLGIKDTSFLAEVRKNGKTSGNIISSHNYGDWYDELERKAKEINDLLGLPEDFNERVEMLKADKKLSKEYRLQWNKWRKIHSKFLNNMTESETIDAIYKRFEEMGGEKDHTAVAWKEDNLYINEFDGREYVHHKSEYRVPSDIYKNKLYEKIYDLNNKDPKIVAMREFHSYVVDSLDKLNNLLPEQYRLKGNLLPQLRKDTVERIKDAFKGDSTSEAMEGLKETFFNMEDDTDRRPGYLLTDENDMPINILPVYFIKRLKDPGQMSTDIVSIVSAFNIMANDYSQMSQIIDLLEVGRDIMEERRPIIQKKGKPAKKIVRFGKEVWETSVKSSRKTSFALDRLDDFYKMVVYGESRFEGKDITLPWGSRVIFNSERLIDFVGKYTAINNLALNVYAAGQNPLIGNAMIRIEGFAKEYVDNGDLWEAEKYLASQFPGVVSQVGSRNHNTHCELWREKMDVQQSYGKNAKDLDMNRKTWISKLFKSSTLFFLNGIGEYYMQTKMSIALANRIRYDQKSGKFIEFDDFFAEANNIKDRKERKEKMAELDSKWKTMTTLFRAYEVKGNKLVLKEGFNWSAAEERRFIERQNSINNSLHGIYNHIDASAMQYYAMGRLAIMFRKFMRPGINRRFRKGKYSYERQHYTEGYYYTFGNFMMSLAKDIKKAEFSFAAHWNELNDTQKRNMYRVLVEASYFVAAVVLANIATNLSDDDDDDGFVGWSLNMWAYQMLRFQMELSFYIDPTQALAMMKSPAAGIDQFAALVDLIKILLPWNWFEAVDELKSGRYKGRTRLEKKLSDVVPLWDTVGDSWFPEDKLVFFDLN